MTYYIKDALKKQFDLLSQASGACVDGDELSTLTHAMLQVCEFLERIERDEATQHLSLIHISRSRAIISAASISGRPTIERVTDVFPFALVVEPVMTVSFPIASENTFALLRAVGETKENMTVCPVPLMISVSIHVE